MKHRRIWTFLLFMLVGLLVQATYITAPLHESGHYIVAKTLGYHVRMHWRSTVIYGYAWKSWKDQIAFAYGGLILDISIGLLLAMVFAGHKLWLSGLFFGYALTARMSARTAEDLIDIAHYGFDIFKILFLVAFCATLAVIVYREQKAGHSA